MQNFNFEASKVGFKRENEKSTNGIGVMHLYNHYLSDTFIKIMERASHESCYVW